MASGENLETDEFRGAPVWLPTIRSLSGSADGAESNRRGVGRELLLLFLGLFGGALVGSLVVGRLPLLVCAHLFVGCGTALALTKLAQRLEGRRRQLAYCGSASAILISLLTTTALTRPVPLRLSYSLTSTSTIYKEGERVNEEIEWKAGDREYIFELSNPSDSEITDLRIIIEMPLILAGAPILKRSSMAATNAHVTAEYASADILLPGASNWIEVRIPTNLIYVSADRFISHAGITIAIVCAPPDLNTQICFGPQGCAAPGSELTISQTGTANVVVHATMIVAGEKPPPTVEFVGPPPPLTTTRISIKKRRVHWRENIEDEEEVFLIRPAGDDVELIDTSQQAVGQDRQVRERLPSPLTDRDLPGGTQVKYSFHLGGQ